MCAKRNNKKKSLAADKLRRSCDPNQFTFNTTEEIDGFTEAVGQKRALSAINFGINIDSEGFNLYAMGPSGIGKHSLIRHTIEKSTKKASNFDWCYIHNFDEPQKPLLLKLPASLGPQLATDMINLVNELRQSIPDSFETSEYRSRLREIDNEYKNLESEQLKHLQQEAENQSLTILRTSRGFSVAPLKGEEIMTEEQFAELKDEEQKKKQEDISTMRDKLEKLLENVPTWSKEKHEKEKVLRDKFTLMTTANPFKELKKKYAQFPLVKKYLERVQQDIIENVANFMKVEEGASSTVFGIAVVEKPSFTRYMINVFVTHTEKENPPIIYEDNPNYNNLAGAIEHTAQFGAYVTDFTLIRPGALHKANGGYLLLDVVKLLSNPYSWEGLKRILYSGCIKIESLGKSLGVISTVSLEPQPIPLNVKVVLFGNRQFYYLLCALDPDFKELFKVVVDFEEEINRHKNNDKLYARFIATLIKKEQLLPFDKNAVARIIDHAARIASDSERLSIHTRSITELLQEANYWALQEKKKPVLAKHVQLAIEHQIHRVDRVRKKLYEEFERNVLIIDTKSKKVGQINALSYMQMGDFAFGLPARVTATASLGSGEVLDIEREVKQGGQIHSKGVLILSGFLRERYGMKQPLSLSASLVFEQMYGDIEGDSASAAECCVLISAIAHIPIKQTLAITGSVDQHGHIQAIGGVNEKIEGFYDICKLKGLIASQGVIIPYANTKHLMLREDVVKAVKNKQFSIYPVKTIDEAMSLLTDLSAGKLNKNGEYPKNSVNFHVAEQLDEWAKHSKEERR